MLIGQICKKTGLSKDTVRYYESLKLISSRAKQAGSRVYRDYEEDSLDRIELIQLGKSQGFKLKEMVPWLDLFVSGDISFDDHSQLLESKIAEVDDRIEGLKNMRLMLQAKFNQLKS